MTTSKELHTNPEYKRQVGTDCRVTGKPRLRQLPTGIWRCQIDGITSLGSSAELAYYGVERAQAIGASDIREKLMRWLVGRSYESGGAYGQA